MSGRVIERIQEGLSQVASTAGLGRLAYREEYANIRSADLGEATKGAKVRVSREGWLGDLGRWVQEKKKDRIWE